MIDVVYIEDEPALVRLMTHVFTRAGLVTRGFTSPEEALAFIADNAVRLVLCDYRMPTMTGLEVLGALPADLPFFLISGDLDFELDDHHRARIAGAFSKPVSPREVARVLAEHLEAKRRQGSG